jgi:hypothetical protein
MKYLTMIFDLFKTLQVFGEFIQNLIVTSKRKKEIKHVEEVKKEVSQIIEKPLNDEKDIKDLNDRLMF